MKKCPRIYHITWPENLDRIYVEGLTTEFANVDQGDDYGYRVLNKYFDGFRPEGMPPRSNSIYFYPNRENALLGADVFPSERARILEIDLCKIPDWKENCAASKLPSPSGWDRMTEKEKTTDAKRYWKHTKKLRSSRMRPKIGEVFCSVNVPREAITGIVLKEFAQNQISEAVERASKHKR